MKTLKNALEPSLLHFLQEILGDREAGGITYYGVGITEGTFGCRRLIREVIRDFGWREDFAAEETAALFRFFYLFLVAEAAIVSLAEDPVFLLLFFLLFLSLFQIPLESSLKIERHMIVRGEDIQRRNVVVVFDQFSLTVIHSFRKTFSVLVQQSHWNLRDIIAEGIQRIVVFLLHLFAVKDILVHQTLSLLQSCGEGLRTIGVHLVFRIM